MSGARYCGGCGRERSPGARFCTGCGHAHPGDDGAAGVGTASPVPSWGPGGGGAGGWEDDAWEATTMVQAPRTPTPLQGYPPSPYSAQAPRPVSSYGPYPPPSPSPPATGASGRGIAGPLIAAITAFVVLAGLVGVYLWRDRTGQPTSPPAAAAGSGGTAAAGSTTNPATPTTTTTTTTKPSPTVPEALRLLTEQRARDAALVRKDGHWTAQLASKYEGVVDPNQTNAAGGHTFGLEDILAEYRALRSRFGPAIRLVVPVDIGREWSRNEQLWITLYDPLTFADEDDVKVWCSIQFPGKSGADLINVCLPRRTKPMD